MNMTLSKSKHNKIILKNGLTLILYQIREVQSIYITCLTKSGHVFGKLEEIGISHFLEHMSYCSTEKYKTRKQISQRLYDIGASSNAQTNIFGIKYWIKAPSIKINESIDLLYQMVFHSIISEKEIENERKVILNEYLDFQNNLNSVYGQKVVSNRFKNLPQYQIRPMGDTDRIKNVTIKNVLDWKNRYINPVNMILTIVGNFNEKNLINLINNTFEKEKGGQKIEFPKFKSLNYSDFSINLTKREGDQVWFDLSFPVFGWLESTRRDELTLGIINYVLGVGPLSRLNQKLREKENLTYHINSYLSIYPSLGYITISASVSSKNLIKSLKHIKNIIIKLGKYGITKKEFDTTKKYFYLQNLMSFETPESIANNLSGQMFDYGEIWSQDDYLNERNKITLDEIKTMINKIFNFKKININLLGNLSESELKKISEVFK